MTKADSTNIETYLKGLKFPVQREEIVNLARKQGANEQICRQLSQLPNVHYRSMNEVNRDLSLGTGSGQAGRN
ncbi:hypothetical protein KDW_37290 [Dictyobacter vulcani]|uniref:DUF2795 domain-containing protein n=1 Tax=Dictyobacter vulcani TaxID=2607529 RepID=A0A5J4KT26_9CHLR|nr:DUF2795 domain-containing protein [Dictyobacter vulcani]GER89567.1 hypothetical protein KDW_37290 [Dictyobacter vulcani]